MQILLRDELKLRNVGSMTGGLKILNSGVIESVVTSGGKIIKVSVNLNKTQITILKLLGQECENYYRMN